MNVTVLNPEAQLLHLCAHLFLHHNGSELLWVRDIAELLAFRSAQYDWDEILSRALEFDLVLPLQRAFQQLEQDHWDVPLAPGVRDRVMSLQPTKIEAAQFERNREYLKPGVTRRYWLTLREMSGWRIRLAFAWHVDFPDPAYMHDRYQIRLHRVAAAELLLPLVVGRALAVQCKVIPGCCKPHSQGSNEV